MVAVQESEWWTSVEVVDMIGCFDRCLYVIMEMEDMSEVELLRFEWRWDVHTHSNAPV